MRLKDKVILITASTRGIGLSCVKACAKEGAICYMGARNLEVAEKTANKLNEEGFRVKCVYNDASKPESFIRMIEEVIEKEGHLDVLVNNFGTSNPQKDLDLAHTDIADYLDIVTLNLRSVFMASQEAAKHMAEHGRPQPSIWQIMVAAASSTFLLLVGWFLTSPRLPMAPAKQPLTI